LLDGLADEPIEVLANKTPLAAAHTPNFASLAAEGAQGQLMPAGGHGGLPHTESAVAALFGLDPASSPGRGLCDAVGAGVPLPPGAVVIRGNVATIDEEGNVLDRRAGRPREGVADLFEGMERVPLSGGLFGGVFHVHEHRLAVVISGPGLSAAVSNSDPGSGGLIQRFLPPRPLDQTPEAARTAEALREFLSLVNRRLRERAPARAAKYPDAPPITGVLTRGASRADERLVAPARLRRGALVGGCRTTLGLARIAGLQAVTDDSMTANLDTNLEGKFEAAAALLESWPYVVLHVKATDIAAHDKQPVAKREVIEAVDSALGRFLEKRDRRNPLRIVITADHGTSSRTGIHLASPVPMLYSRWPTPAGSADFDEDSATRGALGLLEPSDFLDLLLGEPTP
jgi:2,3-bisphosphoglycerate-independent phosphoglycerate mutase